MKKIIILSFFIFLLFFTCRAQDNLEVKIFKINYGSAEALIEVANSLKGPQGKVSFDCHSNSLIVMDVPEYLEKISQVLKNLDVQQKQVELRVAIIEATDSALEEMGISRAQVIIPSFKINAILGFIKSHQDAQVSSQMLVRTISGQPAQIQVAKDAVYEEEVIRFPDGTQTASYIREPVGEFLEATPRVHSDNETITVTLRPSSSSLQDDSTIYEKSIFTQVNINDGDTIVIGGLDADTSIRKQDTSLFGSPFFKREKKENKKTVMFLTVRILD